jgi:hypothetical protein
MVNLGEIELKNIDLWWPRGFGEQTLYEVEVKYFGTSKNFKPQSNIRNVGLRKAELV